MHNRFTYLLLGLWATLSVACGTIYDQGECVDSQNRITFRLSMENERTRTTWGDDYLSAVGSTFDNMILLDALRVAIVDAATGAHIGDVENLVHWSVGESTYQFVGEVTSLALTAGGNYKVVVYANCDTTEDSQIFFTLESLDPTTGAIPMWGVKQVTLTLAPYQDIGTISLLRAAAKVEVALGDAMADYSLTGVTMDVVNRYGYSLPNGWDSVANTTDIVRSDSMREYRSLYTPATGVAFYEISPKSYVLYIPEYSNTDALVPMAKLSVTMKDSQGGIHNFEDAITFGTYQGGKLVDGSAYNIVRNNHYRFNIAGIAGGLAIEYKVADWDEGGEWAYGEFAYPTYHNPVLPDEIYNLGSIPSDYTITTEPTMSYNATDAEAGAFSVWFSMTAPIGQEWTPSLINQSESDYEIRVYKNGTLITEQADMVAGAEWYNIKIIPLKPELTGTVVKFGISHNSSWMHEGTRLYLLINGKSDAIAWPNSGNDPKIIEILQK